MIAQFADIPVNALIKDALEQLTGKGMPFTKAQVVELVRKQYHITYELGVIGKTFPGSQWDLAIETHFLAVTTYGLHRRDEAGVRLFQCWPAGGGRWLWEPFAAFDLPKLELLLASATSRARQAEMSQERISLWIDALKKRGSGTTGDVYKLVIPELKVVGHAG